MVGFTLSVAAQDRKDDKKDDVGFTPLCNGKDLTGWKTVLEKNGDPAKVWQIKDGAVICTGTSHGFCYTEKSYKDFILKYDWKYQRPAILDEEDRFTGGGGVFIHIQNPEKAAVKNSIWPRCVAIECKNKEHGKISCVGGSEGRYEFSPGELRKYRKPVGEWNTTEVTCKDGKITVKVNGAEVASGHCNLKQGPFGFLSDGAEICLRNIRVKELE
jgi:hypothetical protein